MRKIDKDKLFFWCHWIILMLSLFVLCYLMSCSPNIPLTIKADFYVSTVTKTNNKCIKEKCNISIADNNVILKSLQYDLNVNSFTFVHYGNAYGLDQCGKEWEVMVGTMKKEPYLLLLKTDSVAILIGTQCY